MDATATDHAAAGPRHDHTRTCYWDHRRAGWVCPGVRSLARWTRDDDRTQEPVRAP
ncbi:hypothetical protein NYO98_12700 [Nocardioides sp. STR2]|uniref:Uncharacterized protein n=1 Tax=Nocardioides pini TaxID=2975053 RepID=A0ABT4CGL3_9ACTN|nr:hypothetical protein [Nocardioides pini]MCY4727139.1 hypothetical protein [Nocardioides pini]